jgi:hypothetical protein
MKKLFLLPILAILFACNSPHYESATPEQEASMKKTVYGGGMSAVVVIEVDGCEYVFYKAGYAGGLTHKGNCKNH